MNLLSPVFVYALWHANYPTQLPWRALDLRVREDHGNAPGSNAHRRQAIAAGASQQEHRPALGCAQAIPVRFADGGSRLRGRGRRGRCWCRGR